MKLFRHTRVWPTRSGYSAMMAVAIDPEARAAIERWSARGWPLIVRRPDGDELRAVNGVAVGLPLPPSLGKRRFKLALATDDIAAYAPPLALDEIVRRSDRSLAQTLAPLAQAAAHARIVLRVFGSVAWQAETGLDYLRSDSDVDLLAAPRTRAELRSTLALFERAQRGIARRLDGEIVFPDGNAVAWREWAQIANARVLAKGLARVALVPRRALESTLEERLAA